VAGVGNVESTYANPPSLKLRRDRGGVRCGLFLVIFAWVWVLKGRSTERPWKQELAKGLKGDRYRKSWKESFNK